MASTHSDPAFRSEMLESILDEVRPLTAEGTVASYIPALAAISHERLAIAAWTREPGLLHQHHDQVVGAGDADVKFSIQSMAKVFGLTVALQAGLDEELWARSGREPSGDPFNSMVLLEREQGRPRNPFINAGAIVVSDLLRTHVDDPVQRILALISRLTGEPISIDPEVADSERETGFRNRSMANLMRAFGNIHNEVERTLDVYFRQSSISMTPRQVARAIRFLAADGVDPASGEQILAPLQVRQINAVMLMAGTYDAAGAFAFEIGVPCKSGVGGGIMAVVPERATVCVWSPALDETGNSLAGRAALAAFVAQTGLTVF